MRILALSDLHLDLWREHGLRIDPSISRPDIVILAGDIHNGSNAVPWAAATFQGLPVLYVHGNHEPYGESIEKAHMNTVTACRQYPSVRFLNCNEYIQDGIRFLGCTLWTDYRLFEGRRAEAMRAASQSMNDYRLIRVPDEGYRALSPEDTERMHMQQRKWLETRLGEPFGGKTVVITHMSPSRRSVPERYATHMVSAAFSSNLDGLAARADLWIHGHTHDSFDYTIGRCRVVCNPAGYRTRDGRTENPYFDPNLIIEMRA
jgi:predicted phosphodiesterase